MFKTIIGAALVAAPLLWPSAAPAQTAWPTKPVRVVVDGVTEPLTGRLRWISKEPAFTPYYALNEQDRARLVYLAEIDLPDGAQDLPSGLPLQADPGDERRAHE